MAKRPTAAAKKPAAQIAAAGPRINPKRGEQLLQLGDKHLKLALTMNALIEIEEGLGVPLAELGVRMANPSVKDLRTMIGALVRGGGTDMTDEEVGRHNFNPDQAGAAILSAFESAGLFQPVEEGQSPQS